VGWYGAEIGKGEKKGRRGMAGRKGERLHRSNWVKIKGGPITLSAEKRGPLTLSPKALLSKKITKKSKIEKICVKTHNVSKTALNERFKPFLCVF
jgi:hypothetical protein